MDRADIKAVKDLKDLIISQIRALYGPMFPSAHSFDVILLSKEDNNIAYAITYTTPGSFCEWKLLADAKSKLGSLYALNSLWASVQDVIGEHIPDDMQLGQDYEGEKADTTSVMDAFKRNEHVE